jgi:hypothetical protein
MVEVDGRAVCSSSSLVLPPVSHLVLPVAVPLRDLNQISGAAAHSLCAPVLSFVRPPDSYGVLISRVRGPG